MGYRGGIGAGPGGSGACGGLLRAQAHWQRCWRVRRRMEALRAAVRWSSASLVLALAACGGGGGGSDAEDPASATPAADEVYNPNAALATAYREGVPQTELMATDSRTGQQYRLWFKLEPVGSVAVEGGSALQVLHSTAILSASDSAEPAWSHSLELVQLEPSFRSLAMVNTSGGYVRNEHRADLPTQAVPDPTKRLLHVSTVYADSSATTPLATATVLWSMQRVHAQQARLCLNTYVTPAGYSSPQQQTDECLLIDRDGQVQGIEISVTRADGSTLSYR